MITSLTSFTLTMVIAFYDRKLGFFFITTFNKDSITILELLYRLQNAFESNSKWMDNLVAFTLAFNSAFSSVSCSHFCRSSVTSSLRDSTSPVSGPSAPRCCLMKSRASFGFSGSSYKPTSTKKIKQIITYLSCWYLN